MAETNSIMNITPHKAASSTGKSMNSHPASHPQQNRFSASGFGANSRRAGNFTSTLTPTQRTQGHSSNHRSSRRPRLVNEDIVTDPSSPDLGASRQQHGRRGQTSITHLMNFMLPPLSESYRHAGISGARSGNISRLGSSRYSSDKTRYIHANYRFIVRPSGNYELQARDANQPLDWNDILQILASSQSQDVSCPICLSRPAAPRMAKCGHIFCLPCLIRYIHSTQEDIPLPEKKARWKRCPICWDSIHISETKPVRWYIGQENPSPREGDDIVLRLVMRQPGNTLALPRDDFEALCTSGDIPSYLNTDAMDYARIIAGSEAYMIRFYDNEIVELAQLEHEDKLIYGEEPIWTKKAVAAINEAKEKLKDMSDITSSIREQNQNRTKKRIEKHIALIENSVPHNGSRTPSINSNSDGICKISKTKHEKNKDLCSEDRKSSRDEQNQSEMPYLFYQALPHYYLAPLDIRILKSAFGSFEMFPSAVLPRVECIITEHMYDDLRKRTKYLSHLPFGCEVKFLECNWSCILPNETLEQFKEEIERRRKRNSEKKKREERDRVNAERAQQEERWAMLGAQHSSEPDNIINQYSYPPTTSSLNMANLSSAPSAPQGSPLAPFRSLSMDSNLTRTVWGTTLVKVQSPEDANIMNEEIDDGWLNPGDFDIFAENELIARTENLSTVEHNSAKGKLHSKKKKVKKITLMSTTARRTA